LKANLGNKKEESTGRSKVTIKQLNGNKGLLV
jgi:hypothetical protein